MNRRKETLAFTREPLLPNPNPSTTTLEISVLSNAFKCYPLGLLLCIEMPKIVPFMWQLRNQSIPFNICHKSLGPYVWAMTFHICRLYTFWEICDFWYFLRNNKANKLPLWTYKTILKRAFEASSLQLEAIKRPCILEAIVWLTLFESLVTLAFETRFSNYNHGTVLFSSIKNFIFYIIFWFRSRESITTVFSRRFHMFLFFLF